MFHHVARARDHRLAFASWEEGARLWRTVLQAVPGAAGLVVMPDHVHVLAPTEVRVRLGVALGGYARWRNWVRGERGPVWEPVPPGEPVPGDLKRRRSLRYVHLNPCRAGLVDDPLAWPLSTHLDAVGLALPPVRGRVRDPDAFHRYVSADPTVHVQGTELPAPNLGDPLDVVSVLRAVSHCTRTPVGCRSPRAAARRSHAAGGADA